MTLEVTDCPYAAGTKEHHAWIVEVYIPSLDDDRREQDRKRAGAQAIGAELVRGQPWRNPTVNGTPVRSVTVNIDDLERTGSTFQPPWTAFLSHVTSEPITLHWHNPQEAK